jgi:hypothetical protein
MYVIDCKVDNDLAAHQYEWFVDRMHEFAKLKNIKITSIGKSSESQDIYAIDILSNDKPKGQIYVVAGHHGPEPAGSEAAMVFIEKFLNSNTAFAKKLKNSYNISVIPVVDVDEYTKPLEDRNYHDLNQHYHFLSEARPEEKAVGNFFYERKNASYNLTFDLHETGKVQFNGFGLIELLQNPKKKYSPCAIARLKSKGYPLLNDLYFANGVARSISCVGTFTHFSHIEGADAYIFETPSLYASLKDRAQMDLLVMDEIISQILLEKEFNF